MEIGRKSIGKCEVREYISLTQQQMENEVSVLNGLKLVSAKRPAALSAIQFRRNKLIVKLNDQIQLAKAMKDGSTYAPMRTRTIMNRETGEVRQIEVAKKVKAWFFTADSGKVCVQLRYGSKTIDFSKGKNSVEVSSSTELVSVLETLKSAVENGELDAQIDVAAEMVKARFVK